jgi:hypothetical protein
MYLSPYVSFYRLVELICVKMSESLQDQFVNRPNSDGATQLKADDLENSSSKCSC